MRVGQSSVTPTTRPALPSSVTPTMATTPEPTCFLPSSARPRGPWRRRPRPRGAISLTPPTASRAVAARPTPPPPSASFFLRLGQLALELLALLEQRLDARRQHRRAAPCSSAGDARARDWSWSARCWRAASPVSASMRRTPAATALSPTTVIRPIRRCGRHACRRTARPTSRARCRRRLRPSRRRAPRRRISRRTAPARRRRWRRRRAISRVVDRRVLQHDGRWRCPRPRRSPRRVIGLGCEKSKRSRSGATSEPFCATWSPSTWRSASCSRCVAEWLARIALRRA